MPSWWNSSGTNSVQCHFCSSTLDLLNPAAKGKSRLDSPLAVGSQRDFECLVCGCVNRRNERGELLTDEAAYDAERNQQSFAKRAFISNSRMPETYATSPFCRVCRSNQSLQIHLLASYPSSSSDEDDFSDDPDSPPHYPPLLSDYRESLHSRYPLVCSACAPAVEDTLAERDYKAKAAALGWRLRESRATKKKFERSERERRNSWRWWWLGVGWRVRGAAWWATHAAGIAGTAAASAYPTLFVPSQDSVDRQAGWMPVVAALSFLWAFWDPTWERARVMKSYGRPPEVIGRSAFVCIQAGVYFIRLFLALLHYQQLLVDPLIVRRVAGASLYVLLASLLASLNTIRLQQPLSIRLTSSRPRLAVEALAPSDPLDPLASLSLSSVPLFVTPPSSRTVTPHRTPQPTPPTRQQPEKPDASTATFGVSWLSQQPAANSSPTDMEVDDDPNNNSMDWTPIEGDGATTSPPRSTSSVRRRDGWATLAPQRLFAPQEPTGLEGIFERTLRVADDGHSGGVGGSRRGGASKWWKVW